MSDKVHDDDGNQTPDEDREIPESLLYINSIVKIQSYARRYITINRIRISNELCADYINGLNLYNKSIKSVSEFPNQNSIKTKNKGENGELFIIRYLYNNRNNSEIIYKLFGINSAIILIDPISNLDIIDVNNIRKSSGFYKADIIVYFIKINIYYKISIKCNDGGPPTLLNHTPLSAKCWNTEKLKKYLPILTKIINDLNNKRKSGIYKEDIKIMNITNINDREKKCLINVLVYFIFNGTGSCESKCPADSILFVDNTSNILNTTSFYDCKKNYMKKKYVEKNLPNLKLSLRDKGMPIKKLQLDICRPWIYEDIDKEGNIKLKGALHIRFI
jgi:hypothetical protein